MKSPSKETTGFSVIEVIIATAVLAIFMTGLAAAYVGFGRHIKSSGNKQQAVMLAEEGIEAVRNIRDNSFSNLNDGTYGLSTTTNQWVFSGVNDTTGIFNRQITISTINTNQKQITAQVTWKDNTLNRSISEVGIFSNWQASTNKGGMLVYGNGTTTNDSIQYRTLDTNNIWSSPQTAADIDSSTTNKALRAVAVYGSATRNEKVMISRHSDGSSQYIYAQVYNGSSWGNVQLLSSWSGTTNSSVQNFDGSYLANGDFMAIYSDNTSIPKLRVWTGSVWGSAVALNTLTGAPNWIIAKARPGTNEVMVAVLDQNSKTTTQYFNGGTYTNANWSAVTTHSSASPNNARRIIDFAWSPFTVTKGALVYAKNPGDLGMTARLWTANGSGNGSFSDAINAPNQPSTRVLADMRIVGNPATAEFSACDQDTTNTSNIFCYKLNFTPAFTTPTNNTIASPSDNGGQRSFDISYGALSGVTAINVYSDATTGIKLKKYSVASSTWDSAATSVGTVSGVVKTITLVPYPGGNDTMIILADANKNLYTEVWDGTNNQLYTTPTGRTLINQGSLGSNTLDYWFNFTWNNY